MDHPVGKLPMTHMHTACANCGWDSGTCTQVILVAHIMHNSITKSFTFCSEKCHSIFYLNEIILNEINLGKPWHSVIESLKDELEKVGRH